MNTNALESGTAASCVNAELEVLALSGFTQEEIASLSRLREWYQNGGSDRSNVVRHLEFLTFLIRRGKLTL